MRRTLSPLTLALRLFLALAVALVSVHTAMGRAEAMGASELQLCAGSEVVTITLDAQGNPVEHRHTCPDCVLSGLAVAASATVPATPVLAARAVAPPPASRLAAPLPPPHPSARGPPAPVSA